MALSPELEDLERTEKMLRPFRDRIDQLERALNWICLNSKDSAARYKADCALAGKEEL